MPTAKPIIGVNDLQTTDRKIAKEWHPTRNGDLNPTNVKRGSHLKVWWQCAAHPDHIWDAVIKDRTLRINNGCPFCSGNRVLKGFNDLFTTAPEIAKDWHPTKNQKVSPAQVSKGSNLRVWWMCSKDASHEWETAVAHRTKEGGTGCPICSGKKVLRGYNDLETTDPNIAREWHPTRNDCHIPSEFSRSSNKSIWWQCQRHKEHQWKAPINNRTSGRGCPVCGNKKVEAGLNDLTTTHPEIAKQWHDTKNKDLKPTDVVYGSHKRVWWKCPVNSRHEWRAKVLDRTKENGTGCPICKGQAVLEGCNDLTTTAPELTTEWHPTKNGDLTPKQFTKFSNMKVWWRCQEDPKHEWQAKINNRSNGRGCPSCAEHGFDPSKPAWFYLMERAGEQQIGITSDWDTRRKYHERYGWRLLDVAYSELGYKVLETETELKKWLKKSVGLIKGTKENWAKESLAVRSLSELKAKSGTQTEIF